MMAVIKELEESGKLDPKAGDFTFAVYRRLNDPGQPVEATNITGEYRRDQIETEIGRHTGVEKADIVIVNAANAEEACQQVDSFDLGRHAFNENRD